MSAATVTTLHTADDAQPWGPPVQPLDDIDAAAAVDGRHAVAVIIRHRVHGHTSRRLFFRVSAAESAVQRAKARGDSARLVLVRLDAVGAYWPDIPDCPADLIEGEA